MDRLTAQYRAPGNQSASLPSIRRARSPVAPCSATGSACRAITWMRRLHPQPGTRGSHGGLSRAAREIVKLLDAFGKDVIIIETLASDRPSFDHGLAETTVVVIVPEAGDGVQTMKAGLMEIADIFVVNKADREGAERVKAELELTCICAPAADGACRCC